MAHLNMTSPEGTCPSPLELVTSPRSCSHAGEGGCSSVHYSTLGVQFTQICGRAIGYQHHTTDAFSGFSGLPKNIDSPYVDACPSLMTHLASTCGHMLQVGLTLVMQTFAE